jgi:GNAT superfamily N-acetyltransferase
MNITYTNGDINIIHEIQHLWEELNIHHGMVSPFFTQVFETYSFNHRVSNLLRKYRKGLIHIDIAKDNGLPVGYVISTINEENDGEIESLFIKARYRGKGIGESLMQKAVDWLDGRNVQSKAVNVVYGNEDTFGFYAKFGFFPRVSRLVQKERNIQ